MEDSDGTKTAQFYCRFTTASAVYSDDGKDVRVLFNVRLNHFYLDEKYAFLTFQKVYL